MMHNIHVAHGRCYAIAVKNAAIDERNVFRTRRIGPDVEQADSIASLTEPSRGEIADKTRATGNKVLHLYAPRRAHDAAVFHEIRSEEHTTEIQSLLRISHVVFCLT